MRIAVYVHASTSLRTIITRSYGQAVFESTVLADQIFFTAAIHRLPLGPAIATLRQAIRFSNHLRIA
jgi:hypothetical protein